MLNSDTKSFKDLLSFEQRKQLANKYKQKYPGKMPFIVEPLKSSAYSQFPSLQNPKMVMDNSDRIQSLKRIIKQKLKEAFPKLKQYFDSHGQGSMNLFSNKTILTPSERVQEIYAKFRDQDNFIYIQFAGLKVFG